MKSRDDGRDVSIRTTLVKTGVLVGLTVLLMALVREVKPLARAVNHVFRTQAWQSLYGLTGADSGEQRERLILIGITLGCFVCALALVELGAFLVRRLR